MTCSVQPDPGVADRMPDLTHPDLHFRTIGTPLGFGYRRVGRWCTPGEFLIFGVAMLVLDIYVGWHLQAVLRRGNIVLTACMWVLVGILAFCTVTPFWKAWRWRRARRSYAAQTGAQDLGLWRIWDDWQQAADELAFLRTLSDYRLSTVELADTIAAFLLTAWQVFHPGPVSAQKISVLQARIREAVVRSDLSPAQQRDLADQLYDLARLAATARAETARGRDGALTARLRRAVGEAASQLGLHPDQLDLADGGSD